MAVEFSEDYENGTNGAAISVLNTGFDFTAGSGSATFDNTQFANGSFSAKIVSTANFTYMQHNLSNTPIVFLRFALYMTAVYATNTIVCAVRPAGGGVNAEMRLDAAGTLTLRNNFVAVATTTNNIPIGSWFIVEWNVDSQAGNQTAKLYSSLTGAPLETISGTYNQGIFNTIFLGTIASTTGTHWVDTFANSLDSWVGPLSDRPSVAWLS